jgi:signal transduction histidine kinase/PAS domain-containing protein
MKAKESEQFDVNSIFEALNFSNPYSLILDFNEKIIGIGSNYLKSSNVIDKGQAFLDIFSWETIFSFANWSDNLESRIYFFRSKDENQRYKASIKKTSYGFIVLASPIINSKFHINNYGVTLSDFPKHDYLVEYVFLLQASSRALTEARNLNEKLVEKNKSIEAAKEELISLAKFPSENPNPILRISKKHKLLYANDAASKKFIIDFKIDVNGVNDQELKINLSHCLENEIENSSLYLTRNKRTYLVNIRNVLNAEYFNIYANDISLFLSQVEEKEEELKQLNIKIDEQRSFYEYILNNLPSDIAVFSPEHKYLFLNIQAIQDDEIRSFMIGKDDFDYCNFKGVSTDLAKVRREVFNQVLEGGVELEWEDEAKDKDGNRKVVLRKMSPVFNAVNQISHVVGYGIDITAMKISKEILQKNILFQSILMDMATKYINLSVDMVESTINDSLSQIGSFVNVDRVYIFTYDYKSKTASNTYEWCADGVAPQINSLQFIPFSSIPFWIETHAKGDEIIIKNTTELPDGIVKEMLLEQDIKSVFALPLMKGDKCIGFVGFDAVLNYRIFYEDEKDLLRLFGQMLVNVETQTNYVKQINESTAEIHNINTDLELIVAEKTKRNIELSKSISDQEKLVTIGEIASGIAHDLNTPLGAIKIGAESLRYTISELFNNVVPNCSPKQIHFACERAFLKQGELFVGGLQQRKELREFEAYLSENFPELSHESNEVASMMVKSRIELSEINVIKEIIESDNRKDFLSLIYNVQLNRNFIETILSSSERAAKVVQDMRSFIKNPKNQSKLPVNLKDNISTVLNIFNYELKRNVDVQLIVPDDLTIVGVDIKLFQLWSNLIKNAIESMDERKERGELIITAKEKNNSIQVNVQNNGPEIPVEIQKSIFDKFFTTKSERNGSGLGLSIVKNVIEDHNATISVSSKIGATVFKITFKQTE